MKIGLDFTAAQAQEYLATYPITHKRAISLCFQPTDKEKKLVEETIWACRRCYNEERGYKWDESSGPGSTAVAPARKALQIDLSKLFVSPTVWDERGQAPPKPCKLVSFHGLRSHMKAKYVNHQRLIHVLIFCDIGMVTRGFVTRILSRSLRWTHCLQMALMRIRRLKLFWMPLILLFRMSVPSRF